MRVNLVVTVQRFKVQELFSRSERIKSLHFSFNGICNCRMNRFEMTRQKAIILLITAAALWSTSGLFIKLIDWKPLSILGGRTLIVFFVFLIYMRRLNLRLSPMKITGAFVYVGVQLFFIIATKLTAAAPGNLVACGKIFFSLATISAKVIITIT